ncbi:hypothetical protein NDU88_010523 [Pleurodeles waltl]|uniref:Uncharacterized protein n=1 Tax=Pleurodeles waltl TaxID=8319 RepID=A0AAV7QUM4_PLEWA|nr:hypothetical protein NDU88_010523 [Pleurodeles waltl]
MDRLEGAARPEGRGSDPRVDGGSGLQHPLPVNSIERQTEANVVQVSQPVREDNGQSIANMLKALSMELKHSIETSNANQVEIRGLCEDLGKKIDDLAGRTAALEEEVEELKVVVEENKEQIRCLKEGETGVMAKMESLENNLRRNNLRFLRVPEGLEEGDLKEFLVCLIKKEILYDWAVLWYDVRKITKLSYYNEYVLIWDSPGSPEWTKDALAIPLKEAGLLHWKHLCYNGELRDFDNLNIEVGGVLSKFKYLQMKSWVGNVAEEVGSTNGPDANGYLDEEGSGEMVLADVGYRGWEI